MQAREGCDTLHDYFEQRTRASRQEILLREANQHKAPRRLLLLLLLSLLLELLLVLLLLELLEALVAQFATARWQLVQPQSAVEPRAGSDVLRLERGEFELRREPAQRQGQLVRWLCCSVWMCRFLFIHCRSSC